MKKYILAVVLSALSFFYALCPLGKTFTSPVRANAQSTGEYACILGDNAFFYTARNQKNGLFLLPKTYYVKVLESAPDFCKIEYLYDDEYTRRLVGYAKTQDLTFVDYTPKTPYLYRLLEIEYKIDDAVTDNSAFLGQITLTCAYYGDYIIGSKTYCYILRGDAFGYVPKPDDFSYTENTEYAEKTTQDTDVVINSQEQVSTKSTSPAQIAILIAVCLLVPVLAALVLKPSRRPSYEPEE